AGPPTRSTWPEHPPRWWSGSGPGPAPAPSGHIYRCSTSGISITSASSPPRCSRTPEHHQRAWPMSRPRRRRVLLPGSGGAEQLVEQRGGVLGSLDDEPGGVRLRLYGQPEEGTAGLLPPGQVDGRQHDLVTGAKPQPGLARGRAHHADDVARHEVPPLRPPFGGVVGRQGAGDGHTGHGAHHTYRTGAPARLAWAAVSDAPLQGLTIGITAERRAQEPADLFRKRGADVLQGSTTP